MSRIKVIINPIAGRGYAGKVTPLIDREFAAQGADYSLVQTKVAGDAVRLAREARDDGYDVVVAVGGDGTSHEVINGLADGMNGAMLGTIGCIPAGSGNDFAVMSGAPTDIPAAVRMIVEGRTRVQDLGRVTVDDKVTRYFDNAVGIGFDGVVTVVGKRFKRLRGLPLYIPVVLRTIFVDMVPPRVRIDVDGEIFEQTTLMTAVCNGPREGGAFMVSPEAKTDDGLFDVMMVETMPRLQMLAMVPRFLSGTHVNDPRCRIVRGKHVTVTSPDRLYLHADGELLTEYAHKVEATMAAARLRIIAPADGAN
ncbi:MAG: diacylglycerol kinase family lipid kinase [Chloroflexi bacterium]|nr:diacylglycerol kinase family lipid kinase [Chloroflexota bacterium]